MKSLRLLGLAAAVAMLVAFAGVGQPQRASGDGDGPDTSLRTITVNGSGIVSSVPDRAQFSFGVTASARSASQALAAAAADMSRVIATLKAHAIEDADIQTAQVSLSPNYDTVGSSITGYSATDTVTAVVRHLERAGLVIDAAVGAGANQINGPDLTAADQQALHQRALQAAIADAQARAVTIAAAAKATLGPVRSVTEATATPVPASSVAKTAAGNTPIEPGTVQTEADVTVTYDIG